MSCRAWQYTQVAGEQISALGHGLPSAGLRPAPTLNASVGFNRFQPGKCVLAASLLAAGLALRAQGQEALRMSLAGAQAEEARRTAANTLGYYNLKLGPTAWNFVAGLDLEANDNIMLEAEHPRADLIFRPEVTTRMVYPISEQNSLNLAVGGGYSAYTFHPEFNRWFLRPGTELSFDLYVGDFWINFHDRISILEDTYLDPTVVGSADYSQLENSIGTAATWDLNKIIAKLGYDHVNYMAMQGAGQLPDSESEVFSASAGYTIKPGLVAGLEAGGSLISYSQANLRQFAKSATEWNVGGFGQMRLTQHISATASVGYTLYSPEAGSPNLPLTDFGGIYGNVGINHVLNQFVDYSLSGGRQLTYALYGGTVDLSFVRLGVNWKILRKTTLSTTFNYEHGTQATFGAETFDRYGPGISLSRPITAKLTASIGYQFYSRESDLPGLSYDLNVGILSLKYQF